MTARDLIKSALKLGGVLAVGESPSAEEVNDALVSLNDMLDSFSNENLMIVTNSIEDFATIGGQSSFTMGPGGDFDTVRPMGIDAAGYLIPASGANPLERPLDVYSIDEWRLIGIKGMQSTIPHGIFVETEFPLVKINFWPIPSIAQSVRIYSHKQLTNFATLDSVVTLPPGYNQLLKYNLWIVLADEFGREITPSVSAIANKSKAVVKRTNIKRRTMRTDAGVQQRRRSYFIRGR